MSWKRVVVGLLILLLYLGSLVSVVYLSYRVSPPTNADQYKEFGVRAGIAVTVVSAFFGLVVSLFVLGAQIKAAEKLETVKRDIMFSVEERKKELQEQVEQLKGNIVRQNEAFSRTVTVKATAYDKLFVASNACYREFQNLANGHYDKEMAVECERSLREAEGLAANLDDADQEIVTSVVQSVFNIRDEAEAIKGSGEAKKRAYVAVWNKYAKSFGEAVEKLRERSLFRNKSTEIDNKSTETD